MSRFQGTYPDNWRAIAKQIKDENAWKCIRCGHPHDPASGHTLTIHHADNDKSNCAWFNLLCLCQRCHLSIQGKVIMDRPWLFEHSEWFRPYAGGFFALKYLGLIPQQQRTIHERPQAAARVEAAGWRFIRFSGSEVYHNAEACVRQAFEFWQSLTQGEK